MNAKTWSVAMAAYLKRACCVSMWRQALIFSMAVCSISAVLQGRGIAQMQTRDDSEIVVLAFGDSLTAGYMLPPTQAFPVQLEAALRAKGYKVRVINSGVSGDTAAEGLARLDWSVNEKIDAAIVEFGANEALRGMPPTAAEPALDRIITDLKKRGAEVLIAGMEAPRNYGQAYADEFRAMYPRLSSKHNVPLYPFFLKDVATVDRLNLGDGIHPTGEGVGIIVRNMLPDVEKLIAQVRAKKQT